VVESVVVAVRRFLNSPGFKFFLICGLVLVLLIPLLLVWALVEERQQRAEGVRQEVAREWGGTQHHRPGAGRPVHGGGVDRRR